MLLWGFGSVLAWAALPPAKFQRLGYAIVIGPGLGLGLLSLLVFGSFEIGSGFPRRWALWGLVVGIAAVAAAIRLRTSSPRTEAAPPRPIRARPGLWVVLLLLSVAFVAARGWTSVRARPHGGADAVRIWTGRARILFRAGDESPEVFQRLRRGHPDYPLFLSASIAGQFELAGAEDARIHQATGILLAAACIGAVGWALAAAAGGRVAVIGCSILLVTPAFDRWAYEQYSDLALAYVAVVAIDGLSAIARGAHVRVARMPSLLAGFFVGLLPWVKDEGVVLMCCLLAGLTVALWGKRSAGVPWRDLGMMGVGMALPVTATIRFKTSWVASSQIAQVVSAGSLDKLLDPERWRAVAAAFATEVSPFNEMRSWGLVWLAIAVIAVRHVRDLWAAPEPRWVTSAVGLSLAGYFAIYLMTPQPLTWHLRTSKERLFLQLLPLFMVWAGMLIGSGHERDRKPVSDAPRQPM